MKHQKRSFTLVEILVTAGMICLLAAVILIAYNGIYRKWATANTVATMKSAHLALDRYMLENGRYPTGGDFLGAIAGSSEGSAKLVNDLHQECAPYSLKYEGNLYIFDDFGAKPSASNSNSFDTMQEIYYKYPFNDTNTFILVSMGKNGKPQGEDDIIYLPFGLQDKNLKPGFYYCNFDFGNNIISGELEPIAQ